MLTAGHDETPYCHASHEESREIIGERTCYEAIGDVYRVMLAAAAGSEEIGPKAIKINVVAPKSDSKGITSAVQMNTGFPAAWT